MNFGQKIRELRRHKGLSLRALAAQIGCNFTYLSKAENGKLDFSAFPGDGLILKLAKALDADADELLLLAQKIPERIKRRVMERPDVFRRIADLDDEAMNDLLIFLDR